jgi:hypothetical protein
MQNVAGDEGRVLEIENGLDDVVDLAETTDRMQFRQGVVGRRIVHRRADCPEGDSVTADTAAGIFDRQRLVTAFSPPLVSDANAEGTAELAWSTRLVEMFTM